MKKVCGQFKIVRIAKAGYVAQTDIVAQRGRQLHM